MRNRRYGCVLALVLALGGLGRVEAQQTTGTTALVCAPPIRCAPMTAMAGPTCQPLLDDPARLIFKTRPSLDFAKVVGRAVPLTPMDPANEQVGFQISNDFGVVYGETIATGEFIPNAKLTAWKYVLRKLGDSSIYSFRIRKRLNRDTGETEFILKVKAEGYMDIANPLSGYGYTEEQLKTMTIQISVGDDVFYNTAVWERKSNGWYLADTYMFM